MPQAGVPALGLMAVVSRARGVPPVPLVRRSSLMNQVGPVQIWRTDATSMPSFLYTAANWVGASWYLEVKMRPTSAKAVAHLYDLTALADVANSVVTDDMADNVITYTRVRSSAFVLVDGHEYGVQFGGQDGGSGGALGAKLIAVSSGVTHSFVQAVADGGDATVVRPSNWNAAHANALLESHIPILAVAIEVVF